MTIVDLVGLATGVIIFVALLFAVLARSSKRTRRSVATTSTGSPLVSTGTSADRMFGGLELIAAVLLLILSVAMISGAAGIPAILAFLSGGGLAWDGFQRIFSKSRSTIVARQKANELSESKHNQEVGDFLNSLGDRLPK